jgi:hypothetical protein
MTPTITEQIEEFNSLMQAGLEEIGDQEVAEEYFSDAASVLNKIEDKRLKETLANSYSVNPLDFAQ